MSHMVIFTTPDGSEVFNRFDSLDEAVPFLEKLRNQRGVDTAKLYSMNEIEFGFKPVYKVTLGPPAVEATSSASAVNPNTASASRSSAFTSEAPRFSSDEPVGSDEGAPVAVGAEFGKSDSAPSAPIFGVPSSVPPADAPDGEAGARRGLFGR